MYIHVDAGHDYGEFEAPRSPAMSRSSARRCGSVNLYLVSMPSRGCSPEYASADRLHYDGRHAWMRVEPAEIRSWDFRKLGSEPE